jgi:hypothetical protein
MAWLGPTLDELVTSIVKIGTKSSLEPDLQKLPPRTAMQLEAFYYAALL